jgi:uncharacterized protein YqeY
MSLYNTILSDWTAAMKARDSTRSLALANVKAALLNKAVEVGARQTGLSDAQAAQVLLKLQKQAADTIASLPPDSDLCKKETYELSIISSYLPKRLSDDDVKAKVYEILTQNPVSDLGSGMKVCLAQLKDIADGKSVQLFVKKFIEENTK